MPGRPKVFQIPAILDGMSPLKDGGMSVRFHTNEIKSRDKAKLMDFFNVFGWLQFSDHTINSVPNKAAYREAGVKTPSQRLRNTLYVLWQQKYSDQPFDPWYDVQLEKIINSIKERLI